MPAHVPLRGIGDRNAIAIKSKLLLLQGRVLMVDWKGRNASRKQRTTRPMAKGLGDKASSGVQIASGLYFMVCAFSCSIGLEFT